MTGLNGSTATMTETLIRRLPKAELHIHIEGALEARMMLQVRQQASDSAALAVACRLVSEDPISRGVGIPERTRLWCM